MIVDLRSQRRLKKTSAFRGRSSACRPRGRLPLFFVIHWSQNPAKIFPCRVPMLRHTKEVRPWSPREEPTRSDDQKSCCASPRIFLGCQRLLPQSQSGARFYAGEGGSGGRQSGFLSRTHP